MVWQQFFLTCNSSCRVGYFDRGKFCMLRDGVQRNVVYQNFPPPHPPPPLKKDNNSNNSNSYQCGTNDLLTRSSKTNYERTTGELTI